MQVVKVDDKTSTCKKTYTLSSPEMASMTKVELRRRRQSHSLHGGDIENVVFQVTQLTDDIMRFSV